jgi:hypothetical protein
VGDFGEIVSLVRDVPAVGEFACQPAETGSWRITSSAISVR